MITNFFKPQAPSNTIPSSPLPSSHLPSSSSPVNLFNASDNDKVLADLDLKSDPAERKQMSKFSPNIRDRVRRYYILKKPCQPEEFEFPSRDIGGELRRFNPDWFDDPYSQWLEYSVKKDAAFCLFSMVVTCLKMSLEDMEEKGHFLDLLKWYADKKEDVKNVVLEEAPKNNTTTSPDIQKDIVNSCAKESVNAIIEDLNGDYFGILVDESKDVSHKEQMALVLRYVNKEDHSLSRSQIRGQGYDGASNIQGEINGLKTLILKDNSSAYCVHCFAHQLQLTLVAVAKKHHDVNNFFDILANVLNIVGGSFKRREMLRDDQAEKLEELLVLGEVHTGSGLNQELGLQRPGDTRWGSHFKTVRNFISLFSSILHVLGVLANEGANYHEKAMAKSLVEDIRSYEFIYMLHLVLKILAITYDLNMALQ
ncbi:uncharacterized protein LOC132628904 [Lycium barbarum]|uniref:uncharacterized protein LOC132628904 n=1 Tax=Lycium barbarum TaxID=112863 RepID=UPI00293EE00A|nr:uncharacterized protein LOC132628904 [Lycium barbarum]